MLFKSKKFLKNDLKFLSTRIFFDCKTKNPTNTFYQWGLCNLLTNGVVIIGFISKI